MRLWSSWATTMPASATWRIGWTFMAAGSRRRWATEPAPATLSVSFLNTRTVLSAIPSPGSPKHRLGNLFWRARTSKASGRISRRKIWRARRLPGRLGLPVRQPVLDGAQAALHAHDVDVGAAIGDDALVQFQRAAIIVGGLLDLVLLLRQTTHVARVPPWAVAAVAVAVGQLRFLAIAEFVPVPLGFLKCGIGFVYVLQAVN